MNNFKKGLLAIWDELDYVFTSKLPEWYYNVKNYIRNRIIFNKVLCTWRPWDYSYQVDLFRFGIEQLCNCIEKYGNEENISRMKKVNAMKQLIYELGRDIEDEAHNEVYGENYDFGFLINDNNILETISKEKEEENSKRSKKYTKILHDKSEEQYKNIFRLIKGQKQSDIEKIQKERIASLTAEETKKQAENGYYDIFVDIFDGSGIKGWWD